jgi:polyferredoxin
LECVGCAACIDACDGIMQKLKRPKGLIRYDSLNGLEGRKTKFVRPRTVIYTVLLLIGAVVLTFALTKVHDVDVAVMRMRGMPYFVTDDAVRNQFQLRFTTKRNVDTRFEAKVIDGPEWLQATGLEEGLVLKSQGETVHPYILTVPREHYTGPLTVTLEVRSEPGGTVLQRELKFLGPDPRLFTEQ